MKYSLRSIIALLLCLVMLSTTVLTSCDKSDDDHKHENPADGIELSDDGNSKTSNNGDEDDDTSGDDNGDGDNSGGDTSGGNNGGDDNGGGDDNNPEPCTHSNITTTVNKEPSCTQKGNKTLECIDCGETWSEDIDFLPHEYVTQVEITDCGGNTVYTVEICLDCCYTNEIGTPTVIHPHSFVRRKPVEPTCTEKGVSAWFECEKCGYDVKEEIDALGHIPGSACYEETENDFMHYRICQRTNCEAQVYEFHGYSWTTIRKATCLENGQIRGVCKDCGHIYFADTVGTHNYDKEITKKPTCVEQGETTYTCVTCGHSYTSTIPALGHNYGDWILTDTNPDNPCEFARECSICYEKEYKTEHDFGEWRLTGTNSDDPCEHVRECSRCDMKENDTVHDFGEWTLTGANLDDPCEHSRECTRCGEIEYDTIHDYNITKTDPTCTEDGNWNYRCNRCNDEYDLPINKLGHDYEEIYSLLPTCTEGGCSIERCTRCGDMQYYGYDALEHKGYYEYDEQIHYRKCERCGATLSQSESHTFKIKLDVKTEQGGALYIYTLYEYCEICLYEKQIGDSTHVHNGAEIIPAKPATCTEDGYLAGLKCAVKGCEEILIPTEPVDALGHNFVDNVCTRCGKCRPSEPTDNLTEEEWRECFNYFADQSANYTVRRYSATENTRHNATFFIDGEKYYKHTSTTDFYCIKHSDSSYIGIYSDMTGTSYSVISKFSHDGDGDFLTYSELAEYYSEFKYDAINGVYAYHVEEDGDVFILDVKIKDKKLHSMVFIADGMHLIYEFFNYGTTTIELPELETDENYIYEKNEDSTWKIAKCIVAEGDITIPSTYKGTAVTVIGNSAFQSVDSITSVYVPASIKIIDDYAFSICSLTSVYISEGVTYIGQRSFWDSQLKTVSLPNSIEYIGSGAFSSKNGLNYNVKDNINYLGNATNPYLVACRLTESWSYNGISVTIDKNCKFIRFSGEGLNEINVESNNQYFSSYNGVLFNKDKTKLLMAPGNATGEFVVPEGVLEIESSAFLQCSYSKVILPSSLVSIGKSAFSGSDITSIIIGNSITRIEESTFKYCDKLVSVTIGDNVNIISKEAFCGCSSLSEVVFSNKGNLKTIESSAFENCTSLETLILPEGLETLQSNFARESENLKYLSVPNSLINVDGEAFFYLYGLEYNLCNDVAYIGNSENPYLIANDWKGYGEHRHVVIEDTCKFISSIAFKFDSYIESIVLGENVMYIADNAFRGCFGIKEIYNLSNLDIYLGSDEFGEIAKNAVVIHTDLNEPSILGETDNGFEYYV